MLTFYYHSRLTDHTQAIPKMGLFTLILSLICLTTLTYARKPANAVLLSDIKSLTFHAGKLTTARRVDPIPQVRPSLPTS